MKRPALQNKQVVLYEWLFGPEKFSGLSRNGPLNGTRKERLMTPIVYIFMTFGAFLVGCTSTQKS